MTTPISICTMEIERLGSLLGARGRWHKVQQDYTRGAWGQKMRQIEDHLSPVSPWHTL